jgi:hypothetical protein
MMHSVASRCFRFGRERGARIRTAVAQPDCRTQRSVRAVGQLRKGCVTRLWD